VQRTIIRPGYFFPADCVVGEVNKYVKLSEEWVVSQLNCLRVVVVRQYVAYLSIHIHIIIIIIIIIIIYRPTAVVPKHFRQRAKSNI